MKTLKTILAAAALVMLSATACQAALKFTPATEKGWELKEKDGKAKTYIADDGGVKAFCMRSDRASFSIQRGIKVDVKKYPYVTWRWKVNKLPGKGDFRDGDKDDQAAQFFVAFSGDESISYIWDSTAPAGAKGEQWVPWVMTVKILVVETGPANVGKWMSVTRNVYEDYKKLYGKEPPMAEGLRFQINSQYTGDTAESCIDCVEFAKTPPPGK